MGAIDVAVEKCATDPNLLETALQVEGMSDAQQTISGTLLYVLPTRPSNFTTIGYDGQNINYRERRVLAANDEVFNAILKAGEKR